MKQRTTQINQHLEGVRHEILPIRHEGYGEVVGLDTDELADAAELERAIYIEMWGPILDLPLDDDDDRRWVGDAFKTVDFYNLYGIDRWAKQRRKEASRELAHCRAMRDTVVEAAGRNRAWTAIHLVREGKLDPSAISDPKVQAVVKWDARVRGAVSNKQRQWDNTGSPS